MRVNAHFFHSETIIKSVSHTRMTISIMKEVHPFTKDFQISAKSSVSTSSTVVFLPTYTQNFLKKKVYSKKKKFSNLPPHNFFWTFPETRSFFFFCLINILTHQLKVKINSLFLQNYLCSQPQRISHGRLVREVTKLTA